MMKPYRLAALAAVLLVGAVTPANAVVVTYSTSGVFGGTGGASSLTRNGITITYNSAQSLLPGSPSSVSVDASPVSNANFGAFTVTGSGTNTASFTTVDTFTLTINQIMPSPTGNNPLTFGSTLSGTITFTSGVGGGVASVQFSGPLGQTVQGAIPVTYLITEGDAQNPGRVGLLPAGGAANINGLISIAAIPEPGTMALAGIALPLLGLGYLRRRQNA